MKKIQTVMVVTVGCFLIGLGLYETVGYANAVTIACGVLFVRVNLFEYGV